MSGTPRVSQDKVSMGSTKDHWFFCYLTIGGSEPLKVIMLCHCKEEKQKAEQTFKSNPNKTLN